VFISSVRSIEDSNVQPPGLFNKSIIVATPGREIQFTAADQERHDLWMSVSRSHSTPTCAHPRHCNSFSSNKATRLHRTLLSALQRRLYDLPARPTSSLPMSKVDWLRCLGRQCRFEASTHLNVILPRPRQAIFVPVQRYQPDMKML